jgi:hypothetical protein
MIIENIEINTDNVDYFNLKINKIFECEKMNVNLFNIKNYIYEWINALI